MKVKIKNFQSIKEVDLEIKGFTTIVGRSNIGKSAIVRAIDGALTNLEGDSFVRKDEHHTEVHIQCPEIDLLWKKGGGHNDYEINGEKLENVGRGSPEHIGEAGFRDIESSRSKISVQVASQFNPIFLLDPSKVTGSEAAEIISDIGRLSEVQVAFRNCQKDRKNLDSVVRLREKDLASTQEELKNYDELEDDMRQVEELKTQHHDIGEFKEDIRHLDTLKEEKDEADLIVTSLTGLEELVIPKWDGDSILSALKAFEAFYDISSEQTLIVERYEGLSNIEIPTFDEADLINLLRTLTVFQSHVTSAQKDVAIYDGLVDIDIPEPNDIQELYDEYQELEELLEDSQRCLDSIPQLKSEIETLNSDIEDVANEVHSILVDAGECPVCGVEVGE